MDANQKCLSELDNHCTCQRCSPHLVQDVRSSVLTSLGQREYSKRSLIIFEPLLSCFITQFEQTKLSFCSFSKVGPLELFFLKESCPVFGWHSGKESVSISVYVFLYTYSEELFDLKKDRLDEFTSLTNLGVWIKDIVLIVFLDGGKKSVIVYIFLQSFWTIRLIQIDYLT